MTQERRRLPEPAPRPRAGAGPPSKPRPVPFPNGQDSKVTVTMEQKVNLGNYESASVGLILSGVPMGANEAYIDEMLDTGKIAYDRMRLRLKEKIGLVRRDAAEADWS